MRDGGMLRYYAMATVIVLVIVVIATGWVGRELIRIRIASVPVRATPKPGAPNATFTPNARPFIGDAPWALSALPECLIQRRESRGSLAYVQAQLAKDAQRIEPPATLRYADCTIRLTGDEAMVSRGADRFRIPPSVRFYRIGDRLALLRITGARADLRVYVRSTLRMR